MRGTRAYLAGTENQGNRAGSRLFQDHALTSSPPDTELGRLWFLSTTAVFGTPIDITLSALAIEASRRQTQPPTAALRAG